MGVAALNQWPTAPIMGVAIMDTRSSNSGKHDLAKKGICHIFYLAASDAEACDPNGGGGFAKRPSSMAGTAIFFPSEAGFSSVPVA